MSKKENPQRTERQNAVVEIYRQGNAKTVSELTAQLRAKGMKILPRTVRRYLKDVEGVELLERPEKTTEGRRTRQSRVIDVYTADTTQTVPQITAVLKTQGINITAQTVRRYLEKAKIVPPKKEVKIFSPSDHTLLQQKIRKGIANGKRLEEIADETGVSLSTVNRTLRAMGGRKGEKNPTQFKKLSPKERDFKYLPVWQQTWETVQRTGSKSQAAAELGISIDAINSHLTNLGMNFDERRKPRPRKERQVEPTIPKNPSPPSAAEKRRAFILSLSTHEVTIDYLLDQVNTNLPPRCEKSYNRYD